MAPTRVVIIINIIIIIINITISCSKQCDYTNLHTVVDTIDSRWLH